MEALLVIFVFVLIAGSFCGLIAISKISSLSSEIRILQTQIEVLTRTRGREAEAQAASPEAETPSPADTSESEPDEARVESPVSDAPTAAETPEAGPSYQGEPPAVVHLKENWMIWLGGLCVALAGIYLVRYSIELGLLGPTARIALAVALGIGLHLGAEVMRRRTGDVHPAFAAMAGAGSITLFAAFLAALRLYDLIEAGTAFVLMALVAIATMWMALVHGPVLAAFGILGSYLVPILVSSGSGQVVVALIYALIISLSALLLLRYVFRPWLWWGFQVGAFGWWLLTLGNVNADEFRPIYLTVLAYFIVALPNLDWLLRKTVSVETDRLGMMTDFKAILLPPLESLVERNLPVIFILLITAMGLSIVADADYVAPWLLGTPLLVLTFIVGRHRDHLSWTPWLMLIVMMAAWLIPQLEYADGRWTLILLESGDKTFLGYLFGLAVLVIGLSLFNLSGDRFRVLWSSLTTIGPLLLMTLGYVLTSHLLENWHWGLVTALVSLAYLVLATTYRRKPDAHSLVVWLFIGGHYGLALTGVMLFKEASLTLAMALQIISIAWIIRSFDIPELAGLLKLIVVLVIVRLTLNPWLVSYPTDIHWALWSYGGSTICCIVGAYLLKGAPQIAKWAEGAALHLFVLWVWSEVRYVLYDGSVFQSEYTLTEAAIYISLFSALSLVYYRRSLVSETLDRLYRLFSYVLAFLALGNYLYVCLAALTSNSWLWGFVGGTPIFNILLAAFGVPAIAGAAFWYFYIPDYRRWAIGFAGAASFVFVSIQIRHLWEGTVRLNDPTISSGELYTYSAVWLVMAIATILGGTWRFGQDCYRAGMLLLAIVIAKLFLVDMSDLEGLLRVASFMGLGLSLLGISYLHQRLQQAQNAAPQVSGQD